MNKNNPLEQRIDALLTKHKALVGRRGPPCSPGVSRNRPLIEALLARGIWATSVSRILEAETKEHIGSDALNRHRKRECRCPKT